MTWAMLPMVKSSPSRSRSRSGSDESGKIGKTGAGMESRNEPEHGPSRPTKTAIGISTPVLVITILAVLWFTNNLDSILVRLGVPQLTHACVDAGNSFGDAIRCLIYKGETTSNNGAPSSGRQSARSNSTPATPESASTSHSTAPTTSTTSGLPSTTAATTGGCDCGVSDLPHQCGPGLATTAGLSCALANNTFYEYWKVSDANPTDALTLRVWNPADETYETVSCTTGDGVVDCSPGAGGADIRFDQSAVTAYTTGDAAAYAASGNLGPTR